MPIAYAGSNSSDYFEPDDDSFLDALQNAVLPGDIEKDIISDAGHDSDELEAPPSTQPSLKRQRDLYEDKVDDAEDTYGAAHFGDFGEYMRRKRAKLQIQNTDMSQGDNGNKSNIFQGLAIYINGYTQPSVQDLRQLIVAHGGIFQPYLDKKSIVTHIITCSLTPAKLREFKHMKVVRPEWLTESATQGVLLPWKDFIFKITGRSESTLGLRTTQQNLLHQVPSSSRQQPNAGPPQDAAMDVDLPPPAPQQSALPKTITNPIHTTDPLNAKEAAHVPHYASHTSNLNAQRVMANPEWRKAHTSAAPDFIEGYYKNSRLHHMSTWKAELKNLVQEAQRRAEGSDETVAESVLKVSGDEEVTAAGGLSMRGAEFVMRSPTKGKGKEKAVPEEERVIMHCDFDCFFVSAGLVKRPHLRGKPVVVCHSQGAQGGTSSTSEIASSSYEARSFGIKNGMSLQQARKLCPTILTIPYEFELYKQFSLELYTILMSYADDLQAVSVDEALIDVTTTVARLRKKALPRGALPSVDPAKDFAETLRALVRKATGCEVSIGISHNILLARLATHRAKPAGSYHLRPPEIAEFLAPLDIRDLWGFGHSMKEKAQDKLGVTTLGELTKKSRGVLCDALGKSTGERLYNAVRGIDDRKLESDKPRKSVSCEINYGIRFENNDEAEAFIYQMATEVTKRLNDADMLGRSITLKVMKRDPTAPVEPPKFLGHGACDVFNKQTPLVVPGGRATCDEGVIGEHAWRMLKSFNFDPKELRGLGIQIQKLESASGQVDVGAGQGRIPFQRIDQPPKTTAQLFPGLVQPVAGPSRQGMVEVLPQVVNNPEPSKSSGHLDLPSFSQVDMSVFNALPHDVRKELQDEYHRRSTSPFPASKAAQAPMFPPKPRPPVLFPHKIVVKGTNFKRITQQLAPRGRGGFSPQKRALFMKRKGVTSTRATDDDLRKMNIDPEVFALLPKTVQSEQLIRARLIKNLGAVPEVSADRIVLKPKARRSPGFVYRAPPPKARHLPPAPLRRQGTKKGEKLLFTETDDIQGVIEIWVQSYRRWHPKPKDVEFFSKWLVRSMDSSQSTDVGVERAVAVMKWWLVLLKRYWGEYEFGKEVDDFDEKSPGAVGEAWWNAFRGVKAEMDAITRKRFGGRLSLR